MAQFYKIKEIYPTIQGEGYYSGRSSIFVRFTGCNLWSGHERDRLTAVCQFCDTDFVGMDGENGGKYSAEQLANKIAEMWTSEGEAFVVITGGEPLLQLDEELVDVLKERGFYLAIETNGTLAAPKNIDWICVSPKSNALLAITQADELKLVYPQSNCEPNIFADMDFTHFYLQPLDGEQTKENTAACIQYCMDHPQWKLSLQLHKYIGLD